MVDSMHLSSQYAFGVTWVEDKLTYNKRGDRRKEFWQGTDIKSQDRYSCIQSKIALRSQAEVDRV